MQHHQLEKQLQGKEKKLITICIISVQIRYKANSFPDLKCLTTFADCWLQNIDFFNLGCILKYYRFHSWELTWNRLTWILFMLIRTLLRPKCSPQVCKCLTLEFEITVPLKIHFRKPKKQLLHCLSLWALICLAVTFYWVPCFEFVLVSWYMRTEPFGHSIGNPWGIFEGNILISKHNYMYIHCAVICWNIKNVN